MSKVGRNDPCPCGSGKQCRHCRLERAQEAGGRLEADAFAKRRRALAEAAAWLFADAGRRSRVLACACGGGVLAGLVEHGEEDDAMSRTAREGLIGGRALAEGLGSCADEAGSGVQAGFAGLVLPGARLRRVGTGQLVCSRERGGLPAQRVKAELGRRRQDSPVRMASRLVLRGWLEDMHDDRGQGLSRGRGCAGGTAWRAHDPFDMKAARSGSHGADQR